MDAIRIARRATSTSRLIATLAVVDVIEEAAAQSETATGKDDA